ncbi:hypothetical protein GCM10027258_62240 [Amycolatopsis stemonae]
MRSRTAIVAFILSVVALAAAAWSTISPIVIKQDAAAVQTQAKSLGELVTDVCAKGGAAAAELGPNGACVKAAEVQGQTPIAQASVTPAQLRQAAKTAVVEFCAAPEHPCRGPEGASPNFDLIVDAVVAKIPTPHDGRDAPTPDYKALVASYCGQPDEPCRGPKGEKGDSPPCLAEPSQCRGATGERGQPGPTCPDGYELVDAVITGKDGKTYSGKACIDRNSSEPPPSTDPPLPLGGN